MEGELSRQEERIQKLELANTELRERERTLAKELEDLQRAATRLITADGVAALYEQILGTALAILHADFATIQAFYPGGGSDGELRLLGHQGLDEQTANRWRWVKWANQSTCAEALRTRQRVSVPDVRDCEFVAGSNERQGYLDFGIFGAQSTPLISRTGALLGMVSTYWRQPHVLSPGETRALDVLARLAADLLDRSKAEEHLRISEERLRFAQQSARVGTFDWNLETGVSVWTTEQEAIYGLPAGSFAGTHSTWEALVHPEDRAKTVRQVALSFESDDPGSGEWRVIWPDGSIRWVYGRWQVLRNRLGKPVRVMGVNIDITDRKQMEDALRRSEERLRLAVTATNDAIWDVDLKAGTVSWNDTYTTVYGRPEGADSYQWWIDRIHPEDRERTVADFNVAIAGVASSWSAEYRFLRVDGAWAYVYDRAYIARDESGNAWRVIGALQDLTERKRAELALRESEALFRQMADAAPVMIWRSGLDKLCTFFNKRWLEFRGRAMEQELGNAWAEGVHPEDLDRCYSTYASSFDERRNFQMEYRLLRADAEYRFILDTGVPIFSSAGVFEGYIGSCVDITELKRAQEENVHRQKLESIGVLAAGIAHDFNNLIGGILAEVQLVEEDTPAQSPVAQELGRIRGLALRASEIVKELMVYAGRDTSNSELLDLSALVEEILELLKISVPKRAELKLRLARNLPAIHAQPSQIRQLVMNLITNASEALGDANGVITITTSLDQADNNYVRLEVSDTGCGMTEEQQTRIFDPFFSTKFAGRGLGLAVVQGVVRAHRGVVRLDSTPGRGTTFQILLPGAGQSVEPTGAIKLRAAPPVPVSSQTVLVVEDEQALRSAEAKILRRRGFAVLEAADGSSAIEMLRDSEHHIDVILLDLTIPGADSSEVLAEACRIRPATKIVITSAYSQDAGSTFAHIQQITGYIRKPYLGRDLADLIARAAAR